MTRELLNSQVMVESFMLSNCYLTNLMFDTLAGMIRVANRKELTNDKNY